MTWWLCKMMTASLPYTHILKGETSTLSFYQSFLVSELWVFVAAFMVRQTSCLVLTVLLPNSPLWLSVSHTWNLNISQTFLLPEWVKLTEWTHYLTCRGFSGPKHRLCRKNKIISETKDTAARRNRENTNQRCWSKCDAVVLCNDFK